MEHELKSHDSVKPHIDHFSGSEEEEEEIAVEAEDCIARRRERRVIKSPSKCAEFAFAYALSVVEEVCDAGEPNSFSEVVSSQKSTE